MRAVAVSTTMTTPTTRVVVVRRASSSGARGVATRARRAPSDCFGNGESPETKAARALTTLFTVAATRIVLDEEYSYDNEGGHTPLTQELTQFLSERPMRGDGDAWLRALMSESHTLRLAALRIIELRESYAREDFDFERVRRTALEEVKTANNALMVGYVQRSM